MAAGHLVLGLQSAEGPGVLLGQAQAAVLGGRGHGVVATLGLGQLPTAQVLEERLLLFEAEVVEHGDAERVPRLHLAFVGVGRLGGGAAGGPRQPGH